jgi:hypothetical protein
MPTLLYRGHQYLQHKEIAQKPPVQLVYRRSVYQARQEEAKSPVQLTYRGVSYTR